MTINIRFKTVGPLLQIDGSRKDPTTKQDVITQKRAGFNLEIGNTYKVLRSPIFTSNGYRGLLRRVGTNIIFKELQKKGLSAGGETNFHLMNAGGGNNYQAQKIAVEKKVRELNPLVSLFGASLAIRGKLAVTDFVPYTANEMGELTLRYREKDGNIFSDIIDVRTFIKKDDMLDRTGNAEFMSEKELEEWEIAVSENQTARAKNKDDKKVKKETIKHIQSREQVIAGVDFYGSVEALVPLTDIEKGLLFKSVEKITSKRLGSTAASGLGAVDYDISVFGDSEIKTTRDKRFHASITKNVAIGKDTQRCIDAFEEWLKNISEENVQLNKVLV